MKLVLCGLLLVTAEVAGGGLEKYSSFLVADRNPSAPVPPNAIRVTYLGVNGLQFETGGHALLVDPYFTRVGFWPIAFNQAIRSNRERVDEGLNHLRTPVDAVLMTHAHFDHLLDMPYLLGRTGARFLAGPTAIDLVKSFGPLRGGHAIVNPGSVRTIEPWAIRVFAAQHDRLFGKIPFNRCPAPGNFKRPVKASDWCVGEPLSFVIEAGGKRIYIDSGGLAGAPPDSRIGHVDLAILGAALPDSRARFAEAVTRLRPRYIFPSHQDDMFGPLSRGFVFGKMTNFPALAREQEKGNLPGRLILLDYFQPWTLR